MLALSSGYPCTGRNTQDAKEQELDIIDTHQHLIYRDKLGYGWTGRIPVLSTGNFTRDEYAALIRGTGVSGTVFMETGVDDADYQTEARLVSSFVGHNNMLGQIASCRPESDAGFDSWLDECTRLGVVGFRRLLQGMPDDLPESGIFRRNLRKIGARNQVFDICVQARQLQQAVALAKACDEQMLVLDHCGVPDIAGGDFRDWAVSIDQLSALPHVRVKLSGLTAYCNPGTATRQLLQPWVDHVIGCFGAKRILWGGDWPVVNLGAGLRGWIDLTKILISQLSNEEQAAILHGTALETYHLPAVQQTSASAS